MLIRVSPKKRKKNAPNESTEGAKRGSFVAQCKELLDHFVGVFNGAWKVIEETTLALLLDIFASLRALPEQLPALENDVRVLAAIIDSRLAKRKGKCKTSTDSASKSAFARILAYPWDSPTFQALVPKAQPLASTVAAAEGAILPLVVFALFFGFAATQLPAAQRAPMVAFFRAVADTMIIIVRWVLLAAPLGVFALALGVGLTAGVGIAGLILHYIVLVSAVTAAIVPIAFLFAFIWGGANPARFINATAPVLAVAISSRSSLASLPLMVERARDAMGTPERVANLVLPMAVAVFRMTSPVANLGVVFFCASVFGVQLSPGAIIVGGLVAIAISIGSVGLPGEISFIASVAPISMAMGVPIELLGLLVAVEAVPDIFRTVGNVSGDMAATQIVAKNQPATIPPEQAAA
jgi:Na+/H+-dicarboxylate symporter